MTERYLIPTVAMRLKLLVAASLWLMFAIAMEIWWNPFMSYVRALPVCAGLPYLRTIFITFALLFGLSSYFCASTGAKILRAGESPVPTAWVLFRTRVKTGWRARADGWTMLAVALLLASAPVAAGYALRVNVIFCIPSSCGCE
jgi:hypothetical protein